MNLEIDVASLTGQGGHRNVLLERLQDPSKEPKVLYQGSRRASPQTLSRELAPRTQPTLIKDELIRRGAKQSYKMVQANWETMECEKAEN